MHKYVRWLSTASFYTANVTLLLYAFHNELLRQFFCEPLILLECFIALGLIASDFLTPSLSQISRGVLHISDRVSGLTLLALGNAIPDITSTYQAMNAGATSLAVGELFGGIFFLLTIVLGAMTLIKRIELRTFRTDITDVYDIEQECKLDDGNSIAYDRRTFIQDISIFACLILLSTIFLSDGHLMFWECIVMVLAYFAYAAFLVLHYSPSTCESNLSPIDLEYDGDISDLSTIISNSEAMNNDEGNICLFNNGVNERRKNIRRRIRRYLRSKYHGWVRMSLRDCLDLWENESRLQITNIDEDEQERESERDSLQDETNLPFLRRTTSLQEPRRIGEIPELYIPNYNDHQSIPESAISIVEDDIHFSEMLNTPVRPITQKSLSCDHIPDFPDRYETDEAEIQDHDLNTDMLQPLVIGGLTSWPRTFKLCDYMIDDTLHLPTTEYIALLLTTPVALLLSILIPSLDHTRGNGQFHILEVVRLSLVPVIIWSLVTNSNSSWVLVVSLLLFVTLIYRWAKSIVRYNINLVAVAGFLLSLSTISFCVHIIVNTLTSWADIFNISGTILGLTVFAWGNSMGDLVSNIIFMEIGVLDIALGACFGSPLLYFVFGIGVDGIVLMLRQRQNCSGSLLKCQIDFKMDSHLGYSGCGILLAFLVFAIAVPLNRWCIDKKISMLLLTLYAIITGLNVYKEIN